MANQRPHPLTDKIINEINERNDLYDEDLRSAADWQLEQVIEWIQKNLEKEGRFGCYVYENPFYGSPIDAEKFLADLRQAMRPQQQEDNFND